MKKNPKPPEPIASAYRHCVEMAKNHYENFPVASLILPAEMRPVVAVIYAFARSADDFADEGNFSNEERMRSLNSYLNRLKIIADGGEPVGQIFIALSHAIREHELSINHFVDLLRAFAQDVEKKRYANFTELLAYCRFSANPVGRLMLELFGAHDEEKARLSDRICTSLQLINFLQDIVKDYEDLGRIYLPQDDMVKFGIKESDIAARRATSQFRDLIQHQVQRARGLMLTGAPLGKQLPGMQGLQIRVTVQSGLHRLKLMETAPDPFRMPRLSKRDRVKVLALASVGR